MLRHLLLAVLSLSVFLVWGQTSPSDYRNWAATPPMGWNSWDAYGTAGWKEVGFTGERYALRNLWLREDEGAASGLRIELAPHASAMFRVSEYYR